MEEAPAQAQKRKQGFALLDQKARYEVASQGSTAAWAKGTAYKWDSEAARKAGALGGSSPKRKLKGGLYDK